MPLRQILKTNAPTMLLARYKIFKNALGLYRFKLVSANEGEVIFRSTEGYSNIHDCKKAIELCRDITTCEECYVRRHLGRNYFKLIDRNGVEVGISEMFSTTYKRETAIATAKRDGATAIIDDNL